ncbi:MAG: insulinase family protein, partial [Bacteroidota bacterium]|nr:insulinase family protein [Bacteroidota bacterium]
VQSIESLTKDDIVKVANTYLNENYLSLTKKTGSYPKDKLQKPGFAPIVPPNREAKSAYAKALESVPVDTLAPRFLDFEKDVKTIKLASQATLYVTQNPLNDIFTLKLNYGKGTRESRLIAPASTILNYLGTDSLSLQDFRKSLQQLGSTMSFESSPETFTITLSGFDQQLEATLALANQFINRVKPDKKQLKTVIDERKVVEKSERKSTDIVAEALFHKVKFGNNSDELNRFSMAELKKLKATDLVGEFKAVTQVACHMHYCGNQPVEVVAELVKKYLSPETCTIPSNNPVCFDLQPVNEPVVYLINDPKASQSIVYGYVKGEVNPDRTSRHEATLFNNYFGGSMSSLLFQEIREFRSLAYRVRAVYELAPFIRSGQPGSLYMMLSTQCDKTIEAMGLLDSMVREMPLKAERVETCRFDMINAARNKYPDFRTISTQIASLKSNGFLSDPNKELAEAAPGMDITNISSFYDQYVKGRPIAWMIVGNSAQIEKTKLAAFGKLIELKTAAVFH